MNYMDERLKHPPCEACLDILDKRTCINPQSPNNKKFVYPGQCDVCLVRVTDPTYKSTHHLRNKISSPSFKRRAVNFIASMWKFATSGFKLVSKSEHQRRLNICEGCDYRRGNRCMSCGCGLKSKTAIKAMSCPESFW